MLVFTESVQVDVGASVLEGGSYRGFLVCVGGLGGVAIGFGSWRCDAGALPRV